jgi:hypothetical protein
MSGGLMRMRIRGVLHLLNLQTPEVALICAAREPIKNGIDKMHFRRLFFPAVTLRLIKCT